ncbi:hypothetical protein Fcan01_14205 [Folsomia candida]|uniref:C2H2-type domain-containing protein n=1 Tax=Folsomia candida TaxID=158441 RepID=A0A226E0K3_FOLCA|nr:hypothetical protein Fcan01_14205 [Folsomia candida]
MDSRAPTRVSDTLTVLHPPSSSWPCTEDSCNKVFKATTDWSSGKRSLIRHLLQEHKVEIKNTINICFGCRATLRNRPSLHKCLLPVQFEVEVQTFNHVCATCLESFPHKKGLQNHQKIHKNPGAGSRTVSQSVPSTSRQPTPPHCRLSTQGENHTQTTQSTPLTESPRSLHTAHAPTPRSLTTPNRHLTPLMAISFATTTPLSYQSPSSPSTTPSSHSPRPVTPIPIGDLIVNTPPCHPIEEPGETISPLRIPTYTQEEEVLSANSSTSDDENFAISDNDHLHYGEEENNQEGTLVNHNLSPLHPTHIDPNGRSSLYQYLPDLLKILRSLNHPDKWKRFTEILDSLTEEARTELNIRPRPQQAAVPRRPPTVTEALDAKLIQKLYKRNRRRAVRLILDGDSPPCVIPTNTLHQFFTERRSEKPYDNFFYQPYGGSREPLPCDMFSQTEVIKRLRKFENSAPGDDQITYRHWLSLDPEGNVLTTIMNICLKYQRIPETWKSSRTILIWEMFPIQEIGDQYQ